MKRREFVKNLSLGALVFTTSGIMLSSCSDSTEKGPEKMSFKDMESIIKQGVENNFDSNYFENKNTLLIYRSFDFVQNNNHPRFMDVDCFLQIDVIGILKSSFNLFDEEFRINDQTENRGIVSFSVDNPDEEITYYECNRILRFPIKQAEKNYERILVENYKFPCMLTKTSALENINSNQINLIIK